MQLLTLWAPFPGAHTGNITWQFLSAVTPSNLFCGETGSSSAPFLLFPPYLLHTHSAKFSVKKKPWFTGKVQMKIRSLGGGCLRGENCAAVHTYVYITCKVREP